MLDFDKNDLSIEARFALFEILKKYATEAQLKDPRFSVDSKTIDTADKLKIIKILNDEGIVDKLVREAEKQEKNDPSLSDVIKSTVNLAKDIAIVAELLPPRSAIPEELLPTLEKMNNACAKFVRSYTAKIVIDS